MRSLPEHTVDCWVSAAVLARYPEALLWAPTQRGTDNWDMAFELGPGKAFILENKGTEISNDQHTIQIDMSQLDIYLHSPGAAVYYVLPAPPWPVWESTGVLSAAYPVPSTARCRTGAACAGHEHGPFSDWCRVVEAQALQDWLKDSGSKTRTFRASDSIVLPGAAKLGEFLEGVDTCTQGGPRYESAADARAGWDAQLSQRQVDYRVERLTGSGVLGVFVPLPNPAPQLAGGSGPG
jgi:hypothetical protein